MTQSAIQLRTFSQYVEQALRTKSPGFMRPKLDSAGQPISLEANGKPLMECYASGPTTDFLHATTGGLTEIGGEFADQLKAHIFYGKPLDVVNLGEELGDSWWYIAIAANAANIVHAVEGVVDASIEEITEAVLTYGKVATPVELLSVANSIARDWAALNATALSDFRTNPSAKVYLQGNPESYKTFMDIVSLTVGLGLMLGHDVRLVWQSNIAKLARRYGDKFDSHAAQFRRLDEERQLLEANHDANATDVDQTTAAHLIARVNLKTFLEEQDGKFVGIDFVKNDGTDRSLNGRLGVVKYSNGGDNNVEALDRSYLTVFDMKANGYRTVNLATASHVRAGGLRYTVVD